MLNIYIQSKIETYLTEEYEILGRSMTESLIEGQLEKSGLEIFTSEHGSNFDITPVISFVAVVIGAIDVVLKIIDLKHKNKEKIIVKEIILLLQVNDEITKENKQIVQQERVAKILEEVIIENAEDKEAK